MITSGFPATASLFRLPRRFSANDVFTTANRNIQMVLFGVNYRFGGW